MSTHVLAAVIALAVLTVLPGPDLAVVTRAVLGAGRRPASMTVFGIAGGLLLWGAVTVAGLAALLAASATAYTVVKILGAAYLVWLGVQALWRSRRRPVDGPHADLAAPGGRAARATSAAAFRVGLVSNVLNPKIAVFYTGLLPQLVPPGAPHVASLVLLVLTHVLLTLVWLLTYVVVAARASGALQRPGVRRGIDRLTGVVLIGFGARVALSPSH